MRKARKYGRRRSTETLRRRSVKSGPAPRPVQDIAWLIEPETTAEPLTVDGRTAIEHDKMSGIIERVDLDTALRVHLVNLRVRDDVTVEPRTEYPLPWIASQLSVTGNAEIEFTDGAVARFGPRHSLIFRPHTGQAKYRLAAPQVIRFVGYSMPIDRLIQMFGNAVPDPLAALVGEPSGPTVLLPCPVAPQVRQLAAELFAPSLNGHLRRMAMEGVVFQLLAVQTAGAGTDGVKRAPSLTASERNRVEEARRLLLADMRRPPSLGDLAGSVGLSVRRLNMGLRAVFGMTAYELLHVERLEHARLVIEQGSVALKDVAHRVGYNHVSNFINAFTARYGAPPGKYRRARRS
ncbi:MAG: AraC family transcriptional regulator [Rhodospirillaceae bacterium]|nr:AraC family transcriptional regulator [Rhodospirillaceae bacterium]